MRSVSTITQSHVDLDAHFGNLLEPLRLRRLHEFSNRSLLRLELVCNLLLKVILAGPSHDRACRKYVLHPRRISSARVSKELDAEIGSSAVRIT
jgi:hypothetical protein